MKKILACSFFLLAHICFAAEQAEKSLAYDPNGNVAKYIAPHAEEISYVYDPIRRLSEIQYPDGEKVKYAYDFNSNLIAVCDSRAATTYSYDALNRLTKAYFPGNISLAYEYDPANRIVKIVYPDKEEVKYDYDHRGRLIRVLDPSGCTQYEYDDKTNLVTQERLPNGIVTKYRYDKLPRVTGVSHRQSDGSLIAEYQFTYDSGNNCSSVKTVTPSGEKTTSYSYDPLYRLIEASCSDGSFEKYAYDGAGNRTAKITQNGTVDYEHDECNRLIRAGETRFQYDASGNLIKKTSKGREITFSYDPTGRLVAYDNGKNKISFAYDREGRRISKTVNGKKTSFVNDPAAPLSRVLVEKDEQGKTKKRYVYGFSRLFKQESGSSQFFLYDQPEKSVAFLTDQHQI